MNPVIGSSAATTKPLLIRPFASATHRVNHFPLQSRSSFGTLSLIHGLPCPFLLHLKRNIRLSGSLTGGFRCLATWRTTALVSDIVHREQTTKCLSRPNAAAAAALWTQIPSFPCVKVRILHSTYTSRFHKGTCISGIAGNTVFQYFPSLYQVNTFAQLPALVASHYRCFGPPWASFCLSLPPL